MLAIAPIPAVISIPREPPIRTRSVGESSFEPDVLAEIIPVSARPTIVKRTMLQALLEKSTANAPRNGIKPPKVKEIADATAA